MKLKEAIISLYTKGVLPMTVARIANRLVSEVKEFEAEDQMVLRKKISISSTKWKGFIRSKKEDGKIYIDYALADENTNINPPITYDDIEYVTFLYDGSKHTCRLIKRRGAFVDVEFCNGIKSIKANTILPE